MIEDTFHLPTNAARVMEYIQDIGRKIEAQGGFFWPDDRLLRASGIFVRPQYRMKAVPEVTHDAGAVVLTWLYGLYEDFRQLSPCIVWRITDTKGGVRVDASCTIEDIRRAFYQMISTTQAGVALALPEKAESPTPSPEAGPKVPVSGTSEGEALPIPEGKTKYSPEDWDKIFRATSGAGRRPDYAGIAQRTGKSAGYIKRKYNEWRSIEGNETIP